MLMLRCPACGIMADETELAPGGQAHIRRAGPGADDDDFTAYLFARDNVKGVHFERWRHAMGCGKWFHAARDTVSQEVFATYPAQTTEPPADVVDAIRQRRPDWPGFHGVTHGGDGGQGDGGQGDGTQSGKAEGRA